MKRRPYSLKRDLEIIRDAAAVILIPLAFIAFIALLIWIITTFAHKSYAPYTGAVTSSPGSRVVLVVETVPPDAASTAPDLAALVEAYILSVNPHCKDAALAADYIARAANESGIDWRLLAAVARYESTFDIHARGGAHERGLLQVHPVHKARFAKAGLDWDSECDQVRFAACVMLAPNMAKGLRAALRPWAVRARALREYARLQKLYKADEAHMEVL
jgi:hypothetical protein